jgi:hypothetical protein
MTGKTPQQVIIDLANSENGAAVPYNAVQLGAPAVHPVGEEGNTALTVAAVEGAGYQGSVGLTYSRVSIGDLFLSAGIETIQIEGNAETTHGLIPAIAQAYGIILTAADVIDEAIEYDVDGNAIVTLDMADGSLLYTGSVTVDIQAPVAGETSLSDVYSVTVLNGLDYPLMDTSHLTDPVMEPSEPLDTAAETKGDGTMHNGTGNPATGFTIASNGELSLGLTARIYQSGDDVPVAEGVRTIVLTDEQDWNWPFSLRVTPPAGHTGSRPLVDLYEIFLGVESLDTGAEMVLELVATQDGYSLRNDALGLDIVDSYVSEDFTVLQNIQRLKFYTEQFPDALVNGAGSVLGNYKLTLTARRRNSIAPRLTSEVVVSVQLEEQPQ